MFTSICFHTSEADTYLNIETTTKLGYRGLSYRYHLPENDCVLFDFGFEANHTFWMKHVFIPIDIIFIGFDNKVVGIIENAQPYSEYPLSIESPSVRVVETNAGWAETNNIQLGTKATFL